MSEQPKKKRGLWWKLPAIGVIVIVAVSMLSDNGTIETCDDLAPRIIDLSKEQKNPFSPSILKIYDITEQEKTGNQILNCHGNAKLSRGDLDPNVNFYLQQDDDGDRFFGYNIER